MTTALRAREVHKRFGGITVLTGADLEVPTGSITALIGSNGAGKSTLLNVITGALTEDSGDVWLGDTRITGLPTYARARLGMARTFQHVRSFASFTVGEAVAFAAMPPRDSHFGVGLLSALRPGRRQSDPSVQPILVQCRLDHHRETPCGALSYGETKLLMLAQAIATRATVLCFDELCAGLEPALVQHIGNVMKALAVQGKTVLFIEHNLQVVRDLAEHVVFLHQGRAFRHGTALQVLEDPEVVRLYLGQ